MVASAPILATKLYIPPAPPKVIVRARLIERLNERLRVSAGGMPGVTLISAPVGCGKTTLAASTVDWCTHKIGGLHKNDFSMAAKTDEIVDK